jgi:hypothetical protein
MKKLMIAATAALCATVSFAEEVAATETAQPIQSSNIVG